MKALIFYASLLFPTWVCAQNQLVIKGTAPMLKDGTEVMLKQFVPRRFLNSNKTQITRLNGHAFKFILNTDGAEYYYLGVNGHGYRVFLQPGKANINISDSVLNKVSVTGNPVAVEYNKYISQRGDDSLAIKSSHARVDFYDYQRRVDADTILAAVKWKKMDSLELIIQKRDALMCLKWIRSHPNSLINTSILYDQIAYMRPYLSEDTVKKTFHLIPLAINHNVWGEELKYKIDSLFIGGKAPNFAQTDTNGWAVNLASFRGKYVLIDFWASWCVPCREENPALVKVMKKFEGRNFTILGISVDTKRDDWIKAIKQDGLYWTQLSNLQGQANPVAFKYNVWSFPYNYLIDPNGKIIAKGLSGDNLMKALDKIYKN